MVLQCTEALVTLAAIEPEKLVFFYSQLLGQEPKPYILNVYASFNCLVCAWYFLAKTYQPI